jgi:hypothetical protein
VAVDIQYATRADFKFCIAPILRRSTDAVQGFQYLNQAATYYMRGRSVPASGIPEAWGPTLGFVTPTFSLASTAPSGVLIQPALIVVPAPILSWTSLSSAVPGYPPQNLGIDAPVAWRSTGIGTGEFYKYHGIGVQMANQPVDTIAILNTNAAEGCTVNIAAGSNSNFTTFDYFRSNIPFRASANLSGRPGYHALIRLPAPVQALFWRFDVVGDMPGNTFHAEHVVFGLSRASKNYSADMSVTPVDLGSVNRTRNGNVDRLKGFRMRRVAFDISMETEAQYETMHRDLGGLIGNTDPVLVVPNSKAGAFLHDRICYGPMSQMKFTNPTSSRWTSSFTIDSIV